MKIVQIIARVNQGGTAKWLETLIIGLREKGHQVHLLAGSVEENEKEDPCFVNLDGIRVPGLGRSVSILGDLKAIITIRKMLKKVKPDVLNTHTAKAGAIGRIAAIGLGIRVVHTFHGHLLYGYFSKRKTQIIIFIERVLGLFSTAFISVGSQVRDDLIQAGIGRTSKFTVIAPGISTPNFIDRKLARSKFEINGDELVVGWLGRVEQIKRPDRDVELALKLPENLFLIGGEGSLLPAIAGQCPGNLKLVGWSTPQDFWPAADIALLTSDNEGLPTALIEAGLAGIPTVTLNAGSVAEIVITGVNGFVVSDLEGLAKALSNLNTDPELRKKLGNQARELALQKFGVERFIDQHLLVYSQSESTNI
jgi:glycosyltransferase involved in cell wall biosynthesis